MTEKQIINLLKRQQLSLKALQEKAEAVSNQQQKELDDILIHLQDIGVVGKDNFFYYLLNDKGDFLAKVTTKTTNYVILKNVNTGEEVKLSGKDADYLLIGDLVYAKEYQKNIYHCSRYYKSNLTLKGKFSLNKDGKQILVVDYLLAASRKVIVESIEDGLDINQGDLVEATITNNDNTIIYVHVNKVLVKSDDVGSDISIIAYENDARLEFPESVMNEANSIQQELTEADYLNRTDFRNHTVITIDGDDACDFDDAVEVSRYGNGYEIVVHIADVTHYVKKNHPLDDEALLRGTSIYVADRVIPMLPFALSNGICSLNPNVDRLVLSVTMDVDALGNVFSSKVERGVIKSKGRLTYRQVNAYFDGIDQGYSKEINETLTILHEASKKIRRRRHLNGAIDLDSTELKYKLDENGTPISVTKIVPGEAEMMIEDLMIIANCTIAKMLMQIKAPVLYRIHEAPTSSKIATFKNFLKRVDLVKSFPREEDITPGRLNDFLASIKDDALRSSVSYMMLRAMCKAEYSPEEVGHFGLAELYYCHFTSPIRRYPDDIIHREVKDYLIDKKEFDYDDLYQYLDFQGKNLSDLEVKADVIERDVNDLEACKYMLNHIGEFYHGRVIGLVQSGLFIETEIGIEGFLPYRSLLDDHYRFNEKAYAAFGEETDNVYSIGTPIDIRVVSANVKSRKIDFVTPDFYEKFVLHLTDEEKEKLSENGVTILDDYSYRKIMTGKPNFSYRDDEDYSERTGMDKEENLNLGINNIDSIDNNIKKNKTRDDFTPSKEQWQTVDLMRILIKKFDNDEAKVLEVLATVGVSEDEYRKLLRFTKPKERHSSSNRHSSFKMSNRSERRNGHIKSDRRHSSDHRDFKDRRDSKDSSKKRYSSSKSGYGKKNRDR